jgi:hypothetical protein
MCVSLDPRFTGSDPAQNDGILRAIKIHSKLSFGGEVKPSAPVRKIYGTLKNPVEYKINTYKQNSRTTLLAKFLSASRLGVSAATRAENLVDEEKDYNSDEEHSGSVNGRSCMDSLYDTTP